MSLRCLIVDDNTLFREEARTLLASQGLDVVAVAASGSDAVRLAADLIPEVALVDISLGEESGFDVARQLSGTGAPSAPAIILISTHDEREFSDRIAASPALGFIPKTSLSAERIRQLLGG